MNNHSFIVNLAKRQWIYRYLIPFTTLCQHKQDEHIYIHGVPYRVAIPKCLPEKAIVYF